MKKRILPALLALALVLSMLPLTAFAEPVDETPKIAAWGYSGANTTGYNDQNAIMKGIHGGEMDREDDYMNKTVWVILDRQLQSTDSLIYGIRMEAVTKADGTDNENLDDGVALFFPLDSATGVAMSLLNDKQNGTQFGDRLPAAWSLKTCQKLRISLGKASEQNGTVETIGDWITIDVSDSVPNTYGLVGDQVFKAKLNKGVDALTATPAAGSGKVQYTVTFDANGGTGTVDPAVVDDGAAVTAPTGITKDSCELAGWTVGDTETLWNFDTDKVTEPITLKAKWIPVYNITLLDDNTDLFGGKKVSDLGTMALRQDTADKTKITITGSANYVEMSGFNTDVPGEEKGHYVAINIPVTAEDKVVVTNVSSGAQGGKTVDHEAEGNVELLVWMDGNRSDSGLSEALKKGFTFAIGEENSAVTYTVDFSGVTMLPKVDEGTKVETTTGEDGKTTVEITNEAQNIGAKLPETLGSGDTAAELSTVKVEVKPAEVSDVADKLTNDSTPEAVKTAVATEGTKLVEVTVKTITVGDDGAVTENETFNTKDALAATPITITIGGLTSGTQYYVFCIMDDGTVTSYGYVTADGTTITLTTKHLCTFGAAPMDQMTEDAKAALKAAVAADTDNHETGTVFTGVDASKTEPPAGTPAVSTDIKLYYSDGGTEYYGGKLEITGLTPDKYYVVTFDYGSAISGGKVPRAAVAVKADANGRAALSCQNNMKVTVQATGADNNVNAGKLTAIFYDPNATNQGILVTNSTYITQSAAPVVGG